MAPPAKRQKLDGAPRRALTRKAQDAKASRRPGTNGFSHATTSPDLDNMPNATDTAKADDEDDEEEDEALPKPGASYSTLLQSLGTSQTGSKQKRRRKHETLKHEDGLLSDEEIDQALGDEEQLTEQEDLAVAEGFDVGEADAEDASDPFEIHFAKPDEHDLSAKVKALEKKQLRRSVLPSVHTAGKIHIMVPEPSSTEIDHIKPIYPLVKYAHLKQRLIDPFKAARKILAQSSEAIMSPMINYASLLHPMRSPDTAESLRLAASAHVLNHIFKTRDRILKNNVRLAQAAQKNTAIDDQDKYRDQGFTRPKVLILVETRQACVRYIDAIIRLSEPDQQENRKRFEEQFVRPDDDFQDRPADFRELFSGNDDNDFRIGIKFTRKTMKYFSQFYASDIIFASPLGLRRAIRADEPKKFDADFLSSIEIAIVDQADAMLMQNWDHVLHVFEHLNRQPREAHGCDFSRVRQWYLNGHAQFLRQTIVFSAYAAPELNGLFNTYMDNTVGKLKTQPRYIGEFNSQEIRVRQTFNRFTSKSPANDPDYRFDFFCKTVIPSLTRRVPQEGDPAMGVLIFIPSYLDFVRVRNYFAGDAAVNHLSFGAISEYSSSPDVKRARTNFWKGELNVLLYSGRAHHFRRYKIRGVKKVIMYGLPENPAFYNEVVAGYLGQSIYQDNVVDAAEAMAKVLFSKWDGLALERIAGTERCGRMLKEGEGDVFDFNFK